MEKHSSHSKRIFWFVIQAPQFIFRNNDSVLYDAIKINMMFQGRSGGMPDTKRVSYSCEVLWYSQCKPLVTKRHKILMPLNCRCIICKWGFEIKLSYVCDIRLVEQGYSQVPKVYFTEVYLLVMNNITFCIYIWWSFIWTLS